MNKILIVAIFIVAFGFTGLVAADGATLYKKCTVCHGAAGDKIPPGSKSTIVVNTLSKDKIIKNLKGYKAKTLNQYGAGPLMWGQAANLSDTDMEALANYIITLKK